MHGRNSFGAAYYRWVEDGGTEAQTLCPNLQYCRATLSMSARRNSSQSKDVSPHLGTVSATEPTSRIDEKEVQLENKARVFLKSRVEMYGFLP